MAYGALLGQQFKGLLPQFVLADSASIYTSFTATSSSGGIFNGTLNSQNLWTVDVDDFGSYTLTAITTTSTTVNLGQYTVNACKQYFIAGDSLNTVPWNIISMFSQEGTASNLWSVGDTKEIVLNGTVGRVNLDNYSTWVYIIGFNHNSTLEGTGITFGTFKTPNADSSAMIDIALIDGHYFDSDRNGRKLFNINHWHDASNVPNFGGWKGCCLRYDILGSTDVEPSGYGSSLTSSNVGYDATSNCTTSPVSNTLMAALPSDLRTVMKPMTIYTDNKGGGNNTASNVTASVDYLPLLAEFEIFGVRTVANSAEQNYQTQYEYYASGNSKIKYQYNAVITKSYWWQRSPGVAEFYEWCEVDSLGRSLEYHVAVSLGIAPIFRV